MSDYTVVFQTSIEVTVHIDADNEDDAADLAWDRAEEYLDTVIGNGRDVFADASLDGIGADSVQAA